MEKASHTGKSGWASRGGRWWCGWVPNVGLGPGLRKKGPGLNGSPWEVTSQSSFSPRHKGFPWDPQRPEQSRHFPTDCPQSHA